jgi:tetratricopeptide (TPR) repeat protein
VAAYDLLLKARSYYPSGFPESNAKAYALGVQALEHDPQNSRVLGFLSDVLSGRMRVGWPPLTADDKKQCGLFVERALAGAGDDARVLSDCADAMLHGTREYLRALELARYAARVNPNEVNAVRVAGTVAIHCGDLDEANAYLRRTLELSPRGLYAAACFAGLGHVCMIRGEYEDAVRFGEKALAISPQWDVSYWMVAAGTAHLGRMEQARTALAELLRRQPHITISTIAAGQPDYDPNRIAAIVEGLRLAGMAER